jgi:lipopolysaccharide transport system permease protein
MAINQLNSTVSPTEIFSSFWRNRHLIWQMTRREIAIRYRGSIIGISWLVINPILTLMVYTFVFSGIFKARWNISGNENQIDFAIILFVGLIVFNLFAEILNLAPSLIIKNVNFVKKVVFPLEILPWVSIGSAFFHASISLLILLIVQLVINYTLPWTIIFLPIVLLPLVLATAGIAWLMASLGVFLRDIEQITRVLTTILMFLSSVFYPISALPENYQPILRLNPLVLIITESRKVLVFEELPDWYSLTGTLIAGLALAYGGFWWFQKTRKGFADVL